MINDFSGKYLFLSNFYAHEGRLTNEHYFQSMKALDAKYEYYVMSAPTAHVAKARGRSMKMRPDWERVKDEAMLACLRAKFSDPVLADKLLDTGIEELVESNYWHDNYWGDCTCSHNTQCKNPGKNMLGTLLMQVRKEIADST